MSTFAETELVVDLFQVLPATSGICDLHGKFGDKVRRQPKLTFKLQGACKNFFVPYAVYGVSEPAQVWDLKSQVGSSILAYYSTSTLTDEMDRITKIALNGVPSEQVHKLNNKNDILNICRENLRGSSKCYGAIEWHNIDLDNKIYNYTIRGNSGLTFINVKNHKSAVDVNVLPLQWAVDKAITNLTTTPNSMPYTSESQDYQEQRKNRVYTNVVKSWLAPALFLGMIGVIYHLTGLVAKERELGISSLLDAMGAGRFARLLAYHLSFSIVYFAGWIIIGLALALQVFPKSNAAIFIFYHIISGLGMVSFSLLMGSLFKHAQLAGIVSSGVSVIMAIAMTLQTLIPSDGQYRPGGAYALSIVFPPSNYAYFISASARWQHANKPQDMVDITPDSDIRTIVIFCEAIIQIFLFFGLAMLTEQWIHGIPKPPMLEGDDQNAVQISNLVKRYKKKVLAVDDLSLTVRKGQILCILGSNGSGKTTTQELVAGIQRPTSGEIVLGSNSKLGLCPQKNVLWDKLTVREHVEIWAGIKGDSKDDNQVDYWIDHCDLGEKATTWSGRLSGGQKRKLQLAITFVGGSNVCCVDEVSSGLDPLSRRKIWDIILAQQGRTSIILTTHFLDEADLLADNVAIMSKGQLKAEGSTVHLKESLGGYRIFVSHHGTGEEEIIEVESSKLVLEEITRLENEGKEYRIAGPELEDVFLKVASADHDAPAYQDLGVEQHDSQQVIGGFKQTLTMFRKRLIIFRRNPLAEIATFLVPVIVAIATRTFLSNFDGSQCSPDKQFMSQQYSHPVSDEPISLVAGPERQVKEASSEMNSSLTALKGNSAYARDLSLLLGSTNLVDTFTQFKDYIQANYSSLTPGGIYMDPPTAAYQIDSNSFGAYEASMVMNLLNNLRLDGAATLVSNFSPFQNPWTNNTGDTLQFVVYFGLAMSVAPAFLGLYPTFERLSKVRAMHYSNGLRIVPLWIAYTLFNFILTILCSAVLIAIIGTSTSHIIGSGYLFFCFMLYGLSSALLSYAFSLFVTSQLAAFAITAAVQAVYFLLYLIAYMCVLSYSKPAAIQSSLLAVHFAMAIPMPVANLIRALFVSLNLFGVLCEQDGGEITYLGHILAYGGPILYMIVQSVALFAFVVWWDSGQKVSWRQLLHRSKPQLDEKSEIPHEVREETQRIEAHPEKYDGGLRLDHVSKSYDGKKRVVEDVTFGIEQNEVFALLGPNGAGKSTTISMLRGEELITEGDMFVNGVSVAHNRTGARTRLGVCPQFDAMDKMKVVEILTFYGRLRGLSKVGDHVDRVIEAVGIGRFRDRMAHKLSGGNKRKLSLGIALIGDPPVLLLDEPSSGMDAYAKRIMWKTLAQVSRGRSIVLTTHSMEEADALADRAGILAKKLLTIGTTDYLRESYGGFYHIHLICKTAPHTSSEEMEQVVQWVKEHLPGSQVGDRLYQGQIKMSVPMAGQKLSDMFKLFEKYKDDMGIESYAISNTTLEEVFLRIVGTHDIQEQD